MIFWIVLTLALVVIIVHLWAMVKKERRRAEIIAMLARLRK